MEIMAVLLDAIQGSDVGGARALRVTFKIGDVRFVRGGWCKRA